MTSFCQLPRMASLTIYIYIYIYIYIFCIYIYRFCLCSFLYSSQGNKIFEWLLKSSQEQYLHDYWWRILKTQLVLNTHQHNHQWQSAILSGCYFHPYAYREKIYLIRQFHLQYLKDTYREKALSNKTPMLL